MGKYKIGNRIFGIRIYDFNEDDFSNVLFEVKQDESMTHQQMKEAYLFYTEINDKNNNRIHFKIYTECSSTLNNYKKENFMDWYPMSLPTFLENFDI